MPKAAPQQAFAKAGPSKDWFHICYAKLFVTIWCRLIICAGEANSLIVSECDPLLLAILCRRDPCNIFLGDHQPAEEERAINVDGSEFQDCGGFLYRVLGHVGATHVWYPQLFSSKTATQASTKTPIKSTTPRFLTMSIVIGSSSSNFIRLCASISKDHSQWELQGLTYLSGFPCWIQNQANLFPLPLHPFTRVFSMNLSTLQFATWIPLGFSRCSTHGMDVHTILDLTMRYHFKESCRRGFTIFQGDSQAFSSCFQVCINTEEASRNQLVCLQALKQLPLGYVLRTEVYCGGVIHWILWRGIKFQRFVASHLWLWKGFNLCCIKCGY